MTDLDEMDLFTDPDWPPPGEREPRKCRHPRDRRANVHRVLDDPRDLYHVDQIHPYDATGRCEPAVVCVSCSKFIDPTNARRGKSSRRLGHDGERRSEKRYGWRKVGEYGGITDLEGTLAIVQQKTSRRAPPAAWLSIFRALEARAGGRIPLVLLSFVRAGVDTEDFIVLRGRDWIQLHGKDDNPERDNAAFGVARKEP